VDPSFNLSLDPRDLTSGIRSILLTSAGGETRMLDPGQNAAEIHQEHPPVERMEDDWGAICEVFKQSSSYYLILPGVALAPGDRLTITYRHRPHTVTLTVMDLENGRVRIAAPVMEMR
jgi:hypothetical protein